jgi:murein endopeptidase
LAAEKLRFSAGIGTALRAERARAEPARFLLLGGCSLPCGARMLRVHASHQFASA